VRPDCKYALLEWFRDLLALSRPRVKRGGKGGREEARNVRDERGQAGRRGGWATLEIHKSFPTSGRRDLEKDVARVRERRGEGKRPGRGERRGEERRRLRGDLGIRRIMSKCLLAHGYIRLRDDTPGSRG
jgi:hypothetical protein